jgi:uncharacterized membrane protein HdeD (DUF308 family)
MTADKGNSRDGAGVCHRLCFAGRLAERRQEAFMPTDPTAVPPRSPMQTPENLGEAMRAHWGLFLAEGIILVILGILAFLIPPLATLGFTIFVGWAFLISGVAGLVTTFMARQAPGFWWSLLSAIIAIGAGIVLLLRPVSGAISLTLVLIAFFIFEGIASILYAMEHRQQLSGRWGWMLASGVIDLVLAGMVFAGLPGTAAWALGLLLGINMIFGGAALIGMALYAHKGGGGNLPTR